MLYSTNPKDRTEFIQSLRGLADFLAGNPAVPVPLYGEHVTLHADSYEMGGKAQVDHLARPLGTSVTDDTAHGGHYEARREFGPIAYSALAITSAYTARSEAEHTYWGCVIPDTNRE